MPVMNLYRGMPTLGKRTLVARTCFECGELLDASKFRRTTTSWMNTCKPCFYRRQRRLPTRKKSMITSLGYTEGKEYHDAYFHTDFVVVAVTEHTVTVRNLETGFERTHRTRRDPKLVFDLGKCPRRQHGHVCGLPSRN